MPNYNRTYVPEREVAGFRRPVRETNVKFRHHALTAFVLDVALIRAKYDEFLNLSFAHSQVVGTRSSPSLSCG
jgi:hypothetical protein